MPRYYKATTKDGRVATRSTTSKDYAVAFIHEGSTRSNWASSGHTPPEASRCKGELCVAYEISAKDYRELNKPAKEIIVTYTAVDGARDRRKFGTLVGAWKFAIEMVGRHPTLGSTYAVSDDGIGKIEVEGATLQELFRN